MKSQILGVKFFSSLSKRTNEMVEYAKFDVVRFGDNTSVYNVFTTKKNYDSLGLDRFLLPKDAIENLTASYKCAEFVFNEKGYLVGANEI